MRSVTGHTPPGPRIRRALEADALRRRRRTPASISAHWDPTPSRPDSVPSNSAVAVFIASPEWSQYPPGSCRDLLIWLVDHKESASYIGGAIEEVPMSTPKPALPLQELSDAIAHMI